MLLEYQSQKPDDFVVALTGKLYGDHNINESAFLNIGLARSVIQSIGRALAN